MKVTGILLAGGKSIRMGQSKAHLLWQGKPFLQHVIDAALPLCDALLISGNQPDLHIFGYPVVADLREGEGPVTALASCFRHVITDVALVLSCDVPQISTEDLEHLIASCHAENDVTLYTYQGRQMPLVAVYNRSIFSFFEDAFQNHQRKLFDVLNKLNVQEVTFTGEQGLQNINTTEDYATL
jgi:molybdopterin-guanine dinucleotide biosynthesis protein A